VSSRFCLFRSLQGYARDQSTVRGDNRLRDLAVSIGEDVSLFCAEISGFLFSDTLAPTVVIVLLVLLQGAEGSCATNNKGSCTGCPSCCQTANPDFSKQCQVC
jgi:hypothetical protein